MKLKTTLVVTALAAVLAGCATNPASTSGASTTVSRPMSDTTPATPADSRARVHVDLGMAYFEVGRYDVALDEATIALNDSPNYAPAYHLRALAYMLIEENAAARENFERALREAPGDPDFNNSFGWFLCTQGEEQQGLDRLALAARNPYYRYPARPLTNAGLCYLRLKDEPAAEAQFTRAVQADPANGQALYQLDQTAYRADANSAQAAVSRAQASLATITFQPRIFASRAVESTQTLVSVPAMTKVSIRSTRSAFSSARSGQEKAL